MTTNNSDRIQITILLDGTIKFETGSLAGPNHTSADKFVRAVEELAGGEVIAEHKHGAHRHTHTHDGEHKHEVDLA